VCDLLLQLDLGEAATPFFKTYLGKRLLRARSIGLELETTVLRQIDPNEALGAAPRTMLRDVTESEQQHEPWTMYCLKQWANWSEEEEIEEAARLLCFEQDTYGAGVAGVDNLYLVDAFRPIVITRSEWPSVLVPMVSLNVPREIDTMCRRFGEFYRSPSGWQSSNTDARAESRLVGAGGAGAGLAVRSGNSSRRGHKIIWSKTAGSVTLGVTTGGKTYSSTDSAPQGGEVVLSVVQACVLLSFNERRSVTFEYLLAKLDLEEERLYAELR
jgi:hypothetical protein